MPLYDYRCTACQRTFETLLPRWDAPSPACPECGGASVRQLSVFAVTSAEHAGSRAGASAAPGPCGSGTCACRMSPN